MIELIESNKKAKPMAVEELRSFPWHDMRLWFHYKARYSYPTIELIEWLRQRINGRSALEIGAGCGDLGYHLGIPMTDSYQQQRPEIAMIYALTGQPVIEYGRDVEKIDALAAVKKYRPQVVIASWVTHWVDPDLPPPPGGGNAWGIKEDELLNYCDEYIMIGCVGTHKHKPILKLPHTTIDAHDLVVSRSNRDDDKIWIWQKAKEKETEA